ncbi:MAG: malonyl-CoA O-methyltransferase [Lentimonas sp.]|jgi:malonyl-CoA O-methyltransferase
MTSRHSRHTIAFDKKVANSDFNACVQRDAALWLAEWLPKDSGAESCLEFGSGTGLLTQYLINHFVRVEATDLDSKVVAKCRQRLPEVRHQVRDAWARQPDAGSWDFIASSSLLQWSESPSNTLRQWGCLLRPNHRLLIGFFIAPSLSEMNQVIGTERGPIDWRSHPEWIAIFNSSGLKLTRTESRTVRYEYDSALQFWKSLNGTSAAVSQHMRPSQMFRLLREYETNYKCKKGVYATWTFCRAELSNCR